MAPYLHDRSPYVMFFVAVTAVAWFAGLGPALLSTVLGFLAADWFFIAPGHTVWVKTVGDAIDIGSYFLVSLAIAFFSHAMYRAHERTRARSRELEREIAERKRAEEEVARLASFPMLNPRPVVEVDLEGHVCFANPSARQMFPDLMQHGPDHPWLADWKSRVDACRKAGVSLTTREVAVAGRWYHQTLHFVPEVQRIRIYGLDITDRKAAEEALRESQQDLNRAQAVAHTGSWRLNVRRDELLWSDETHRIFGIPQGTPMTYEAFLATVLPEDRQYVDQKWTAALRGEPYDIEHRIVVDGKAKWVRERAELEFDKQGILLGGFGTAQDVTERKAAEEALQKAHEELEERVRERTAELLEVNKKLSAEIAERRKAEKAVKAERQRLYDVMETLPVYVVLLTPDYHVPFANRFFRERFGESHGRRCFEYLFGRTEPCQICGTYTVMKTKAPHHWEWTGPDGRNYDIFDFPFTDSDGSSLIMEMGIDITERKRAEAQLRKLASDLTLAEQRERQRIARVLHDHLQQLLVALSIGWEPCRKPVVRRSVKLPGN